MEKDEYVNIPTFVGAGESSAAKSHTVAMLVNENFVPGMEQLTGNGMTTSCQTEVIIDPKTTMATVEIKRASNDEIRTKLLNNLQLALISECKNVVASLPANDEVAKTKFVLSAADKRSKFTDETFRIHRLLIEKKEEYRQLLITIFEQVINRASETSFRKNCNEAAQESKSAANNLIEMMVMQILDEDDCKNQIENIVDLINKEICRILNDEGFIEEKLNKLDSQRFIEVIKVISNSEKKELEETASIACGITSVRLVVPGKGIDIGEDKNCAYRIIDVVGFNNDGLDHVDERLRQAVLTQYAYDGIIYFASRRAINKTHESYLSTIFKTMRPAKIVILSTFMDQDIIYESDEYPSMQEILNTNEERKNELLRIIKSVASDNMHIILPEKNDIICISNKVSKKRNGDAALKIFNEIQYDEIRRALGRIINIVRKRISIGVDRTSKYMLPVTPVEQYIGQIINQLGTTIDNEYSKMRDTSNLIHHWTLDAVLWNMLLAYQHISNARVWKNVHITTFTDMENICLVNLGKFKFSSNVKVAKQEDIERIRNEFIANLNTELYRVVRRLILVDVEDETKSSVYKEKIRELARQSKYNKWKIIDELRLCLMTAVAQKEYLERMLEEAINKALIYTYDKMLY